ncbi:MAG: hypothetical protein FD127_2677 [Acidimicrobiaceae bacterium]|nr:MAG: hypothetical protein FD127_2677 [Acidimicrobiaceae bacterium]
MIEQQAAVPQRWGPLGRSGAQRRHGPDEQGRDGDEHERGQRADDKGEGEPHRKLARRHLGMTPTMVTGVVGESLEHRGEREAGARARSDGGREGEGARPELRHERVEGVVEQLSAIDMATRVGEGVAPDCSDTTNNSSASG